MVSLLGWLTAEALGKKMLLAVRAALAAVTVAPFGRRASLTTLAWWQAPSLYPAPPRGVIGGGGSVGGGVQVVWVPEHLDLAPSDVQWDVG